MQNKTLNNEAYRLLASKVTSPRIKRLLLEAAAQPPAPPHQPAPPLDRDALRRAVEQLPASNLTKLRLIEEGSLRPATARPALHGALVTRTTAEEAVRQALRHGALTARAVADDTGLPRASVYHALSQLAAGGAVHVVGKGTRTDPFLYSINADTDDLSHRLTGLPAGSLRDPVAGQSVLDDGTVTIPEE